MLTFVGCDNEPTLCFAYAFTRLMDEGKVFTNLFKLKHSINFT